MATIREALSGRLAPIVDRVAHALGQHNIKRGDPAAGAPGVVRVVLERDLKRVFQVYWTPFQVEMPGTSVALYLDIPGARRHWTEAYLAPDDHCWVFTFYEREDGDTELAYYQTFEGYEAAVDAFFTIASWYGLTPTNTKWEDFVFTVDEQLDWTVSHDIVAQTPASAAMSESLKKSTIAWIRYKLEGREHTIPVWYVNDQKAGKMYVLSGEREQRLPGAEGIKRCEIIFRQKGKNVRVAEVPASVRVLEHGEHWDEIAEKLAEKRLNIPGLPEETAKRWRDECHLLEITLAIR